jgi:hypothetical protein
MEILGLAFVPIMFVNATADVAALTFWRGADFLSPFNQPQTESRACYFSVCVATVVLAGSSDFRFSTLGVCV